MTDRETQLKALAFDHLMQVLEGRHELVDQYRFIDEFGPTVTRTKTVLVYQWRLRLDGRTDLAQALLSSAEADFVKGQG